MTNVTQLKPALTFAPYGTGLAIYDRGVLVAVVQRDALPELLLAGAGVLRG